MSKTIRFVSVLGLVAAAAASQAVSVFITSRATNVTSATGTYSPTITFNGSDVPFSYILANTTMTETLNGTNSTATYTSGVAASPGAFTITFNSVPDNSGTGSTSFSANTVITSATGVFAPYLGSTGLTAASNANTQTGFQQFTVSGNVTPEPASLAALGVGAVALLRRRRKA